MLDDSERGALIMTLYEIVCEPVRAIRDLTESCAELPIPETLSLFVPLCCSQDLGHGW